MLVLIIRMRVPPGAWGVGNSSLVLGPKRKIMSQASNDPFHFHSLFPRRMVSSARRGASNIPRGRLKFGSFVKTPGRL